MDFAAWYEGFRPQLVAALTLVAGDCDMATDAADEAMVRALARWSRVSSMASAEGWVFMVGRNVLRRRRRRQRFEHRLAASAGPPGPPGSAVSLRAEVWDVVRALPERQRQAIALRYLLDLTEQDVAAAMGVAVGTASATLTAARARLATLFDEENLP